MFRGLALLPNMRKGYLFRGLPCLGAENVALGDGACIRVGGAYNCASKIQSFPYLTKNPPHKIPFRPHFFDKFGLGGGFAVAKFEPMVDSACLIAH